MERLRNIRCPVIGFFATRTLHRLRRLSIKSIPN